MQIVSAREHQFWLKILEEHALFIYDHLSPREREQVRQAEAFVLAYQQLQRRVPPDGAAQQSFGQEALEVSQRFWSYKVKLLGERIHNTVVLNLTPAFFNGIIMELEEYIRLLLPLAQGKQPPRGNIFHHLFLWLPDQIGHAALLFKDLDISERELSRQAQEAQTGFTGAYLTAIQMQGFTRAEGEQFPVLDRFVADVATAVQGFYRVVQGAVELYQSDRLLSRTTLPFLQHHFPESEYFLFKLAEAAPQVAKARPELFVPPGAR